ncbi:MAG: amidohydrolase, partial [Myxococcota bacterium]
MDPRGRATDALLVRDGWVVAHGEAAVEKRRDGERVHEPDAACVFPALTDAHCHLWGVGLREGAIDLEGTSSPQEIYARLEAFDVDNSPSGWVLGHGWDEHGWPKGAAWTRAEVDAVLPNTPLCLHRIDRHAIVVNGTALERAGLGDDYSASGSGRVIRDAAGEIVVLVDTAMRPLLESIPEPTEAEDEAIFRRTAERYRSLGITAAHMALLEPERIAMLERLRDEGELPLRVYGIVDAFHQDIPEVLERGPLHDDEAWLSIRAAKLFADGALGSQGALLHEPYPNGEHGIEMMDVDTLTERTLKYTEAGFQVATHAIGDAGATAV